MNESQKPEQQNDVNTAPPTTEIPTNPPTLSDDLRLKKILTTILNILNLEGTKWNHKLKSCQDNFNKFYRHQDNNSENNPRFAKLAGHLRRLYRLIPISLSNNNNEKRNDEKRNDDIIDDILCTLHPPKCKGLLKGTIRNSFGVDPTASTAVGPYDKPEPMAHLLGAVVSPLTFLARKSTQAARMGVGKLIGRPYSYYIDALEKYLTDNKLLPSKYGKCCVWTPLEFMKYHSSPATIIENLRLSENLACFLNKHSKLDYYYDDFNKLNTDLTEYFKYPENIFDLAKLTALRQSLQNIQSPPPPEDLLLHYDINIESLKSYLEDADPFKKQYKNSVNDASTLNNFFYYKLYENLKICLENVENANKYIQDTDIDFQTYYLKTDTPHKVVVDDNGDRHYNSKTTKLIIALDEYYNSYMKNYAHYAEEYLIWKPNFLIYLKEKYQKVKEEHDAIDKELVVKIPTSSPKEIIIYLRNYFILKRFLNNQHKLLYYTSDQFYANLKTDLTEYFKYPQNIFDLNELNALRLLINTKDRTPFFVINSKLRYAIKSEYLKSYLEDADTFKKQYEKSVQKAGTLNNFFYYTLYENLKIYLENAKNASAYINIIKSLDIKTYYLQTVRTFTMDDKGDRHYNSKTTTRLIFALDQYYQKGTTDSNTDSNTEYLILRDYFLKYLIDEYNKQLVTVKKTHGGKQNYRVRRSKKHKRKNARKSRRYSR